MTETDRAIEAAYSEQELLDYRGNPMIEALPPILSKEDFTDNVTTYPAFNRSEKRLSPELRLHCVERLHDYFQPLDIHIELERKISRLIRRGYIARNPLEGSFNLRLRQIHVLLEQARRKEGLPIKSTVNVKSTASGPTLIGLSGMGKSTAIEKILKLYPQVILHGEYQGLPLNFYQIVWLKIDCSHAGSLKGLCGDFFKGVDALLGTDYYEVFATRRHTEDVMLAQMCLIAVRHGLGILVIDELQNLSLAKSGGAEKAMNFFVKLVNNIGVPVMKVGTSKALSVLQADFRLARRSVGISWDRFHIKDARDKELWDLLIEELFSYQWTREDATFSDDFNEVLYDESQGITDIALKLYMMAQWRAIAFAQDTITPNDIRIVAAENLKMVQPMLHALRTNNQEIIQKYGDIQTKEIAEQASAYFSELEVLRERQAIASRQKRQVLSTEAQPTLAKLIQGLMDLDIEPAKAKRQAEEVFIRRGAAETFEILLKKAYSAALDDDSLSATNIQAMPQTSPNKPLSLAISSSANDLRIAFKQAKESKRAVYDALSECKIIKPPLLDIFYTEAA